MTVSYLALATVQRGEERHFFSREFESNDDRLFIEWAKGHIDTAGFDRMDPNVEVDVVVLEKNYFPG